MGRRRALHRERQGWAAVYRTPFGPEKDGVEGRLETDHQGIGSWDINLEATYGGLDYVAAYVRTRVWSEATATRCWKWAATTASKPG
jgi:hypothetical protein